MYVFVCAYYMCVQITSLADNDMYYTSVHMHNYIKNSKTIIFQRVYYCIKLRMFWVKNMYMYNSIVQ